MRPQPILLLSALLTILLVFAIGATGMGYINITPLNVVQTLGLEVFGFETTLAHDIQTTFSTIVMDVRLPRILSAAMVGGGLAIAGTVFQAILLNPLADPYTLGISSGAAFGASIAFLLSILGISIPVSLAVPIFAFIGALLTLVVVFWLASTDRRLSSSTLILSGVIVSAILSAGIGFLKYLADEEVNVIIFWLMGSFVGKSWHDVIVLLSILIPTVVYCCYYGRDLNIMALGSTTADTLGVDSASLRKRLLVAASLLTAACVSIAGVIGFIGLIVPHTLRFVSGPDNRVLLPTSFLAGCSLLLLADTLTRAVLPHEIPIGILTALIGGPFFCVIFRRRQLGGQYGE